MIIDFESIEISGFQSIGLDQSLTLTKGVYAILGINHDSGGGSNGSGKSSLARAITAAVLGPSYAGLSVKDTKNMHLKDVAPRLCVTLLVDKRPLKIERIIGHSLKAWFDGKMLVGKASDVQDEILRILGLNADQWLFLTHKRQGDNEQFLYLRDANKKEFLLNFFQVAAFERCQEDVKKEIKSLSQSLIELEKEAHTCNALLQQLDAKVSVLKEKMNNFDLRPAQEWKEKKQSLQSQLEVLQQKALTIEHSPAEVPELKDLYAEYQLKQRLYEEAVQSIVAEKKELTDRLLSLHQQKSAAAAQHAAKITLVDQDIANAQKQINICNTKLQSINSLKAQKTAQIEILNNKIAELELFLAGSSKAKCGYCGQHLPEEKQQEIIQTKQKELSQLKNSKQGIEADLLNLNEKEIEELKIEAERLLEAKRAELLQLKVESSSNPFAEAEQSIKLQLMEIEQKISAAQNAFRHAKSLFDSQRMALAQQVKSHIDSSKKEINLLSDLLTAKEQEYLSLQNDLKAVTQERDKLSDKHTLLEQKIKKDKEELEIFQVVEQVVHKNGLLSYLFDDLLEALNVSSNNLFKKIPLTERFTIHFSSSKNKASGSNELKDRVISYTIQNELGEEISIDTLSGAERQILVLLVDVALDNLLASRMGVQVNFKMYDEQLSYLDSYYKDTVLHFFEQNFQQATLLLVDHGSELHSAVNKRIMVEKRAGISYITVL